MDVDLTHGSTNAQIMRAMVDTVDGNDIRELVITQNITYNAFILTNYSFTLAKPNTNGFIIDDTKAREISNLIGLVHVAKQTQALPIGEPLGSLDILSRTCLGPRYICYYCLYNDYNDGSNYVVALSRESQYKGKLWMFRHKEVDDKTNASEYILISSVWGSDSWIQTLGGRVSVGDSFSNTRTYVFKDNVSGKYLVYSSNPGTVAAPQTTQVRPVVAPPAATPPAMMGPAVALPAAASNTQTAPSNGSILEDLKLEVKRHLETYYSSRKEWYPYQVHLQDFSIVLTGKREDRPKFSNGYQVTPDTGYVWRVEGFIPANPNETLRRAMVAMSQVDSQVILKNMFEKVSPGAMDLRRSYLVYQFNHVENDGSTGEFHLIGTYDEIYIHDRSTGLSGLSLALKDDSYTRRNQQPAQNVEQVVFQTQPAPVQLSSVDALGGVVQQQQPQQPPQPPQPQVQQPQQPQVQQPPEQLPVQQPVQQLQPIQLPQQVQPSGPAPVPAHSTMPYSVVLPAPPATSPSFEPPNQGAASCTYENPCFTWKFTEWKHAGSVTTSVTTSVNTPVLPSSNLEFKISKRQMENLGIVANDTGYTLSFKNNQGTFPAYIQITSNTSPSYSLSLVAIRPDVSGLENVNRDPHCDAVWITTATKEFVRCKIEVTDAADLVPGIYLEWAVPHIDAGRYLKDKASTNLPNTYDPSAATAMNHGIAGLFPSSVVASYAQGSIVPNDLILHRIDGATAYQGTHIIAPYTGPTNPNGGGVEPTEARKLGYTGALSAFNGRYKGLDTMNIEYFDGGRYKINPHFRFIPPWFEGSEAPSILCIGDSLTDEIPSCSDDMKGGDFAAYSTLLQRLLHDVGITATVENIGNSGSTISRHSPKMEPTDDIPKPPRSWNKDGRLATIKMEYTLAIIWLGTNDIVQLGTMAANTNIKEDFIKVMRDYKANHYLLVKVDGTRGSGGTSGSTDCSIKPTSATTTQINLATCLHINENVKKGVEEINKTLEDLEKEYSNVHVAEIDFSQDRCPTADKPFNEGQQGYLHFLRKDSIAKSIFGRIMCHAIFHRESGDLRWVGAVPATKLDGAKFRTI